MKVLEFIKHLPSFIRELGGEKFHDIVNDTRPEFEKAKDYIYRDDVILPRGRVGKRVTKLPFKALNQGQTGACGAFSAAHMRKIEESEDTDPFYWYRNRSNYPNPGMNPKDVLEISAFADAINTKAFSGAPTDKLANSIPKLPLFLGGRKYKYEYVQYKAYDANAVFDGVSNGRAVLIGFYSTLNEWREEMYVRDVTSVYTSRVHHYVVALPNSIHVKDGFEWVSVIDSSPQYGFSLRHIRKDFLEQRMYIAGGFYYPVKVRKAKKITTIPSFRCEYGQRSHSVLDLQRFLTELGLLAPEHNTSYYGPITSKAVLEWQSNHLHTNLSLLTEWAGHYWGPASITKVKELYS